MSRLSLILFGSLTVTLDAASRSDFHSDKSRALLAFLAVECDRPHRRETLAGLLWPGYPERSARASLSQALFSINQFANPPPVDAPPLIAATRTDLQLNSAACQIDTCEMSTLLDEVQRHRHRDGELCASCVDRFQQALLLYTGDLLAGFSLRDSPEFEEWLLTVRERYRRQALSAAEALTVWGERQGGGEAAIASARRWAELDPLDEPAQRCLIRLLAGSGQRSPALAHYEAFRRMLRAELGIEPEAETRALFQRVRAGDPSVVAGGEPRPTATSGVTLTPEPAVPEPSHDLSAEAAGEVRIDSPRHNLPAPVDSFVGRERELSEVQGMLRDPAVRMVTLVGMGGMGKTRLALEAARSLLTAFADGVWLVDLAPLPTIPPRGRTNATAPEDSVERAIARVLQVNPETTTDLTARIVLALQGRELLLVMDNCEHVLEDAVPALARLLSSCPALTVLATSREPLRVAGEHLYEIPALGFPADTEDLELGDVLRAYSAVQLFAQRAAAARYGVAVDGDNLEPAIAICRLLDGMPLAIELAAARLSAMAMTELAGALASSRPATGHGEERWSLLSAGSRAAHPRQRALQATVAWSYNLLEEQERLLFDRLSVFSGTFDLDAVAWVCGDGLAESGMPAPDMIPASLAALVDCSLVQRVQVEGDVLRYRLLETLRVYALERLAERGETYATSWRHADYYLQLTESQETALRTNTPEAVDILFRLDEERDNLAAAIRWCLAHGRAETAARIAGAVEWWAMYHTHLEEYAAYVRRALEHEFELPPLVRAKAWDLIALYAFNWGRNEEFAAAAKAELQAAREAEDGYWMGWAVSRQGMHALVTGDDRRAEALLRQSREIWHEYGEQGHTAMHETLLARYQPPGERLRYAERVLPASPNPCNAYLFQMAGVMAYLDGYLERAEALRRTAVKLWADLGNRTMEGALCASLGAVCLMRGAGADEVLGFGQRATRVARTSGHLPAYIERQWEYGDMLWHLGRLPEALHALEEALAQALHHGEQGLARQIRESLAQVHLEREDLPAAQAACDAVPGSQDDDASVRLLDARGRMAALRGDTAGAVRLMRLALEGARGWTVRPDVAIATEHVGWALAENGELDEAASLLAEAQSERDAMGMVLYPVEVPHHERAVATVEGRA